MNNQKIKELEDKARELADEIAKLKAEPEVNFKEGELVLMGEHQDRLHLVEFKSKGSVNGYYTNGGAHYEYCKKLEVLPINFTPWGGGDCPCEGEVLVELRSGARKYGNARAFIWFNNDGYGGIIGYQRIEIL